MIKYYFINKFNKNNINKQDKRTIVIYRNYSEKKINESLLLKIKYYCKKKGIKLYLSNNVKLSIKLDLDGVYIPSFNKSFNHLCYSKKTKLDFVGSAHNLKEIRIKEKQGVNKIFISSLFKKNKNFLGLYKFKLLSKQTNKKIVALGGISERNIKKLQILRNPDFAGISFFE